MRIIAIIGAVLASAIITQASNWDETPGQFFARDRGQAVRSPYGTLPKRIKGSNDLAVILATTRRLGLPDAFSARVCKVESGCKINGKPGPMTRHGRHWGAYQTRVNVAMRFGYSPAEGPLRGMVALKYGAMHLADCYRRAKGDERKAAKCHQGGPGALERELPIDRKYAAAVVGPSKRAPWAGSLRVAMR